MITITASLRDLQRIDRKLASIQHGASFALRNALNKTAVTARKSIVDEMIRKVPAQRKGFNRAMKITSATRFNLVATISIKSAGIPLIHFKARQTKAGVTASTPSGGRIIHPGAFITRMPTGHRGVFRRKDSWQHRFPSRGPQARKRKHGLPIRELRGPSAVDIFQDTMADKARAMISERLHHFLGQQIRGILDGSIKVSGVGRPNR